MRALDALLLIACAISFVWGTRHVFERPDGHTFGMGLVRSVGLTVALLHLGGLVLVTPRSPSLSFIGAATYCCSLALFWWCVRATANSRLSAVFSTDLPRCLIRTGPYRLMRHPFYTAYLLAYAAGAVATQNALMVISALLMVVVYGIAATHEEWKFSRSPLKHAYDEYRRQPFSFS